MKRVLLTWYGITDLRSAFGFERGGDGPILGVIGVLIGSDIALLQCRAIGFGVLKDFHPAEGEIGIDADEDAHGNNQYIHAPGKYQYENENYRDCNQLFHNSFMRGG